MLAAVWPGYLSFTDKVQCGELKGKEDLQHDGAAKRLSGLNGL